MPRVESFPLFSELSAAATRAILSCSEERVFSRSKVVFRQGDELSGLFLVVSGSVKLSQIGHDGQEVIMRLVSPGGVIAAVAAFAEPQHFPVGATALSDVTTRFWERPLARDLAKRHPGFVSALAREISCQTRSLQLRLREVATEKVPQRLAQLLLRLAEQAGVPEDGGVRIDIPLTRQDLAQMTGTTMFTVSRLLSEWAEHGLVAVGRARVSLRSELGLQAIADWQPDGS